MTAYVLYRIEKQDNGAIMTTGAAYTGEACEEEVKGVVNLNYVLTLGAILSNQPILDVEEEDIPKVLHEVDDSIAAFEKNMEKQLNVAEMDRAILHPRNLLRFKAKMDPLTIQNEIEAEG